MKIILPREESRHLLRNNALVLCLFLAAVFLMTFARPALAGGPEYLQLKLQVGMALEIEGKWDPKGYFVASDIDELPQPRRPKLRGPILKVNAKEKSISMYGLAIEVNDKTEFIESGDKFSFDSLKAGMRVEVSCKIGEDGSWQARKIKARGVKDNDKIKGTISRVAVDGKVPDTVEVSSKNSLEKISDSVKIPGILILLVPETDAKDARLFENWIGEKLFGELDNPNATRMTNGILLNEQVFVSGEYRHNLRNKREFDLSKSLEYDADESEQDTRLEVFGFWDKNLRSFGEVRLRKRFLLATDQNLPSNPYQVQLIQLYLLIPDLGGKKLALQVGRQDFDEPREWLFDDYLDAVRLYYYGVNSVLLEGAFIYGGESYKEKFRTWTDLFGSVRWYFNRESFVSAYVISRSDTDEIRKREPSWWGLRYYGRVKNVLRPWAELAIIRGEDKHKSLEGWAIDVGATAKAENTLLRPSLTFAYAVGSGDNTNTDQVDHRFRQTAYEDNVDRFGGVTSVISYGSVVNPELSNLKILTLGIGIQPTRKSSVELLYHRYQQHYADNDIKGSNLVPLPFGVSTDIGWALDLVIGIPKLWEHIKSRWTLGWFKPGEAFQPLYTEIAFLSKIDIRVGF